jgi:hypothetical protein
MADGFKIVEARSALTVPRIVGQADDETLKRFLEFFTVPIRNKNTGPLISEL